MKKAKEKNTETELLELLKKVLPKATHDSSLAGKIYEAVESELKSKSRASAFLKFCSRVPLPDLEPRSIEQAKLHLLKAFGEGDLTVKPHRKEKALAVELALTDGTIFSGEIKVNSKAAVEEDDGEPKPKFAPFPVCVPGDQELVWLLAKHENLSPDEAGMALSRVEEDFWASKAGQKLIRDRVERIFPEFIMRVPAGMLSDAGLKRHYKTPEPLKVLRVSKKK
jgi:hypothetical protein